MTTLSVATPPRPRARRLPPPGGVAATLNAVQPLMVAGLALVLLGQRPGTWRLGCGVAGLAGVALMVLRGQASFDLVGVAAGNIQVVVGDLDDPRSLPPAFEGVQALWLLVPNGPRASENSINAVWAARQIGVERVVRLSVAGAAYDAPTRSQRRIQAVEASASTSSMNNSEGFFQLWILRGRSLLSPATIAR